MSNLFRISFFIIFISTGFTLQAQQSDSIQRKKINLIKISESPKIDGVLDDSAWQNAPIAKGFVEREPKNGQPEPDSLRTEVKIVYDDLGIYFGAMLYDSEPDKIQKELTERDRIENDDIFSILINGYNDHQQSLQFIVTAAGVQYDAKITNEDEDESWNAVWYSAVKINEIGWVAEIFIPYSELRFPKKEVQIWGLQFERNIRRTRVTYSWNFIDNTKGQPSIYDGAAYGIQNITPPTRLSFQPYLSGYVNNFDGKTDFVYNGGMDLKYGINDAFTLDMVLIPDFGQTKFDPTVLNLTAFEVQYDEQRPFFTEGTELFNRGGLFYSRRIGDSPRFIPQLSDDEEILSYPAKVDLINAMKVSGRTAKGLGIGVFNAVTEREYAEVKNTNTGENHKELIEPLTNYNVLVLDQRFGSKNSISFVNTNTWRENHYRDANVSGLYFDVTNRKNTWNYYGNAELSLVRELKNKNGFEGTAGIQKISGKHRYAASFFLRTKDYDIDDLGYTGQKNYINYFANYSYRILQPTQSFNKINLNFNLNYNRRLEPDLFNFFGFNFNYILTTLNHFTFGGQLDIRPFEWNDIYEPRMEGRFVKVPANIHPNFWISSDFRRRFAIDATVEWNKFAQEGRHTWFFEFAPRFRVSDRWKLYLTADATFSKNEQGFVSNNGIDIFFGERNRNTFETALESQFIFNEKMALNLAFRHYYTDVNYQKFYTLQEDGELLNNDSYSQNHNTTYNNWNLDLRFSWWFAPGSQLTFLYRNAVESFTNETGMNFNNNFKYLFDQPQLNSFSIRISYYLDYNRVKNIFRKKPENEDRIGLRSYQERGNPNSMNRYNR